MDEDDDYVTCLACGKSLRRIQWTHFKVCSSGITSLKEYKAMYPNSATVSKNVAKTTTLTYENFIIKYGHEDGVKRWNTYCQKQRYSNSYEYKSEKYGWTREQYDEYNESRAITLDNLIKKYGSDCGKQKYEDYCARQKYTTSKEYFIRTYGAEDGYEKWWNFYKSRTSFKGVSKIELEAYNYIKDNCVSDLQSQIKINNYTVDMYSKSLNLIIEFFGTFWHMDSRVYDSTHINKINKMTAGEIWRHDEDRINRLKEYDPTYIIYIIKERDWRKNKNKVIEQIKKVIENERS